jgi:predicted GIY-YIG superfamily endonuclease
MPHPQGRTAAYRLYDRDDKVIYVGISNNPHARWSGHAADKPWWGDVVMREVEWFETREDAERIERQLIGSLTPRWNTAPGMPERITPAARGRKIRAGWEPPAEMTALIARYEREQQMIAATRDELEAFIVAEMTKGVSAHRMSKFLPWEPPMIAKIGKRGAVPPLRPATVVSARKARA